MAEEYEVIGALRVAYVERIGDDLFVDLYGGQNPIYGGVRFTFRRRTERDVQHKTLERWAREDTSVTYVKRGGRVTLVDEASLLRRGLRDFALD